jgi:glutamate/tyrosine decarboxylase-like PLP-dependent enzyme
VESLLADVSARAACYLDGLENRPVAPTAEALARLALLDEPLPQQPTAAEAALALLDEIGSPATMATAGSRFFCFVVGGALPVALAANWLASAWDQNAGLAILSPIAAKLEEVAIHWLLDVLRHSGQSRWPGGGAACPAC